MLIESLLKRNNGTTVSMDGVTYHFAPDNLIANSAGIHVCLVDNPDHQARFLAITEGYREVMPEKPKAKVKSDPAATA
jgi:hypothetical protein